MLTAAECIKDLSGIEQYCEPWSEWEEIQRIVKQTVALIESQSKEICELKIICKRREYCGSCSHYGEAHRNDFCRVKGPHIPRKRHYQCDIGMWTDQREQDPSWKGRRWQ